MSYIINSNTGYVVRTSDGVIVAPAQSIEDPAYVEYINWVNAGNSPTYIDVPDTVVANHKITKLAFRNRFTTTEKVMLEMASLDNPQAAMASRQAAAALRVFLKDLDNATFVDISRADTIAGVNQLVTFGLLTADRATHILTDAIQPSEQPGA